MKKQQQQKYKEKESKEEFKQCFRCGLKINPKDRYVELATYFNEECIQKISFHISCWGDFNNDKVHERITEMAKQGMSLLGQVQVG